MNSFNTLLNIIFSDTFLWIVIGTVVAFLLLRFRVSYTRFLHEVKVELNKCSWPWDASQTGFKRYKELIESTLVVIVSTILLAGFVSFCDLLLQPVIGLLTGGGIH